jgi:hypothetical protein
MLEIACTCCFRLSIDDYFFWKDNYWLKFHAVKVREKCKIKALNSPLKRSRETFSGFRK